MRVALATADDHSDHLSSAVLLGDGVVVAACSFPRRSIEPISWLPFTFLHLNPVLPLDGQR